MYNIIYVETTTANNNTNINNNNNNDEHNYTIMQINMILAHWALPSAAPHAHAAGPPSRPALWPRAAGRGLSWGAGAAGGGGRAAPSGHEPLGCGTLPAAMSMNERRCTNPLRCV